MSRLTITSAFLCLVIAYLGTLHMHNSVVAYENAYDLLERRNQRFYEPQHFQRNTFYDGRNRFFNQNRHLQHGYYTNPYLNKFENGYDNLGNGLPLRHFHPFIQHLIGSWRFEKRPSHDRNFNNFYIEAYPTLRGPEYDHANYLWRGFYPSIHSNTPVLNGMIGNQFSAREKTDRFIEDNENKKNKKTDEYYQRTQEGVNIDSLKREKTGEKLHTDQAGENKLSLRSNKIVKKSRTTKGFAVHHHKDETGNSTTFFDETSDFGGQSDLRDIADGFNTRRTLEKMTHEGDEKHAEENEAHTGNYGTEILTGNQKFEKNVSSLSGHDDSKNKFHTGNESNDFGLTRNYQYLNGDRFEYTEPNVDNYY